MPLDLPPRERLTIAIAGLTLLTVVYGAALAVLSPPGAAAPRAARRRGFLRAGRVEPVAR